MTTTNHARSLPIDRTAGEGTATNRWAEIWSPTTVSRTAGLCALAYVASGLLSVTGDRLHTDMSAQQVLTWATENQRAIWSGGFLSGLGSTLLGLLIILVVALTGGSGILATVARVAAAGEMATGWVAAGVLYALADLAQRGGADAGVLALFSLAKTMVYTDGIFFALAVGCISVLVLRSRALPVAIAWFGLFTAVWYIVSAPIQIAATSTDNGITNQIGVVLALLWLLAMGVLLLVRPVRTLEPERNP